MTISNSSLKDTIHYYTEHLIKEARRLNITEHNIQEFVLNNPERKILIKKFQELFDLTCTPMLMEFDMKDYNWDDLKDKSFLELIEIKKEKVSELAEVDKKCNEVINGILFMQKQIYKRENELKEKTDQVENKTWNCCKVDLDSDEQCPICSEKYED